MQSAWAAFVLSDAEFLANIALDLPTTEYRAIQMPISSSWCWHHG
jgi:hypothetical protein